MTANGFLDELSWRGLVFQTTNDLAVRNHLSVPGRVGYCGFDPTAPSLTIGNFVAIKLLMHWQRAGHRPIVLMGGGTGLIGDPSGKDAERQLRSREEVEAHVAAQRVIFERLLDFDPKNPCGAIIVNNLDWLEGIGYIEMLRDVGKHFSVNAMMQRDSVKRRLESREHGISYTEFSYMLLQAYDFLHLYRTMGCTVQTAGSDQFGNIVSGIDLIRREHGHGADTEGAGEGHEPLAFGVTAPLVTDAEGRKIGKTERGAVWLTADMTSPYRFHQFWINVADADVANYLRWFTLLDQPSIEDAIRSHESAPHERGAQRLLAREMTTMLHGSGETSRAEAAAQALFSGDVRSLDAQTAEEIAGDLPATEHLRSSLQGEGVQLVDVLAETSLAKSRREAREFLGSGAIMVNGERAAPDRMLVSQDLLFGRTIFLRRGRKHWHATRWI